MNVFFKTSLSVAALILFTVGCSDNAYTPNPQVSTAGQNGVVYPNQTSTNVNNGVTGVNPNLYPNQQSPIWQTQQNCHQNNNCQGVVRVNAGCDGQVIARSSNCQLRRLNSCRPVQKRRCRTCAIYTVDECGNSNSRTSSDEVIVIRTTETTTSTRTAPCSTCSNPVIVVTTTTSPDNTTNPNTVTYNQPATTPDNTSTTVDNTSPIVAPVTNADNTVGGIVNTNEDGSHHVESFTGPDAKAMYDRLPIKPLITGDLHEKYAPNVYCTMRGRGNRNSQYECHLAVEPKTGAKYAFDQYDPKAVDEKEADKSSKDKPYSGDVHADDALFIGTHGAESNNEGLYILKTKIADKDDATKNLAYRLYTDLDVTPVAGKIKIGEDEYQVFEKVGPNLKCIEFTHVYEYKWKCEIRIKVKSGEIDKPRESNDNGTAPTQNSGDAEQSQNSPAVTTEATDGHVTNVAGDNAPGSKGKGKGKRGSKGKGKGSSEAEREGDDNAPVNTVTTPSANNAAPVTSTAPATNDAVQVPAANGSVVTAAPAGPLYIASLDPKAGDATDPAVEADASVIAAAKKANDQQGLLTSAQANQKAAEDHLNAARGPVKKKNAQTALSNANTAVMQAQKGLDDAIAALAKTRSDVKSNNAKAAADAKAAAEALAKRKSDAIAGLDPVVEADANVIAAAKALNDAKTKQADYDAKKLASDAAAKTIADYTSKTQAKNPKWSAEKVAKDVATRNPTDTKNAAATLKATQEAEKALKAAPSVAAAEDALKAAREAAFKP